MSEGETRSGGAPSPWRRPSVGVAAAVLVVALSAAAVLQATAGEAEGPPEPSPTAPLPTSGGAGPSASADPRPPVASGPGSDPALSGDGVTVETFDRGGPDLGSLGGSGPDWEVLGGEWAVEAEELRLVAPDPATPSVAAVDVGVADVRAEVVLTRPGGAAGVAFRVQDADTFFVWAWASGFGNLVLLEVTDGRRTVRASTGPADLGEEGSALGIAVKGTTVQLLFDGAVAATYDGLPSAEGRERIGVAMVGAEGRPTFDDLRVDPVD